MRLEGSLDAFSLPDIFQLLSFTKKTGALHLSRSVPSSHGVVYVRAGAVTGACSDVGWQGLARRLVGAGHVEDDALGAAVARAAVEPTVGVGLALREAGAVDEAVLHEVSVEHATDAVFDLLRWTDGDFAFVMDEANPDELGATLPVDDVVAEGRRRLESWGAVAAAIPSPETVVSLALAPAEEPALSRDEWALLALVDGRRTVRELVALTGRGDYVVVAALAGLVDRGLLVVNNGDADDGVAALVRRQGLLAELERDTSHADPQPGVEPGSNGHSSSNGHVGPNGSTAAGPVVPARPEPFLPRRRPEHAEEPVEAARTATMATMSVGGGGVGGIDGTAAMAPDSDTQPASSPYIERDPSVNKSLLLRLIAGVRGL